MNKQQLSEALAAVEPSPILDLEKGLKGLPILAAARLVERLLPKECENCDGGGLVAFISVSTVLTGESGFAPCPPCHGSGRVWDEGIVEAVAKVLNQVRERVVFRPEEDAHAVLSAVAELLTEKVET